MKWNNIVVFVFHFGGKQLKFYFCNCVMTFSIFLRHFSIFDCTHSKNNFSIELSYSNEPSSSVLTPTGRFLPCTRLCQTSVCCELWAGEWQWEAQGEVSFRCVLITVLTSLSLSLAPGEESGTKRKPMFHLSHCLGICSPEGESGEAQRAATTNRKREGQAIT